MKKPAVRSQTSLSAAPALPADPQPVYALPAISTRNGPELRLQEDARTPTDSMLAAESFSASMSKSNLSQPAPTLEDLLKDIPSWGDRPDNDHQRKHEKPSMPPQGRQSLPSKNISKHTFEKDHKRSPQSWQRISNAPSSSPIVLSSSARSRSRTSYAQRHAPNKAELDTPRLQNDLSFPSPISPKSLTRLYDKYGHVSERIPTTETGPIAASNIYSLPVLTTTLPAQNVAPEVAAKPQQQPTISFAAEAAVVSSKPDMTSVLPPLSLPPKAAAPAKDPQVNLVALSSFKPRLVNDFHSYTLADYRKEKEKMKALDKIGGLGPDRGESFEAKAHLSHRMQQYSQRIRQHALAVRHRQQKQGHRLSTMGSTQQASCASLAAAQPPLFAHMANASVSWRQPDYTLQPRQEALEPAQDAQHYQRTLQHFQKMGLQGRVREAEEWESALTKRDKVGCGGQLRHLCMLTRVQMKAYAAKVPRPRQSGPLPSQSLGAPTQSTSSISTADSSVSRTSSAQESLGSRVQRVKDASGAQARHAWPGGRRLASLEQQHKNDVAIIRQIKQELGYS